MRSDRKVRAPPDRARKAGGRRAGLDPDKRIIEDPLRIIRALRFQVTFSFFIDEPLMDSIKRNKDLLKNINQEKINQDIKKCPDQKKLIENLKDLDIL